MEDEHGDAETGDGDGQRDDRREQFAGRGEARRGRRRIARGRGDLKQSGEIRRRSAEAQEIAEAEGQLGGGDSNAAPASDPSRAAGKEKPAAPMISGRAEIGERHREAGASRRNDEKKGAGEAGPETDGAVGPIGRRMVVVHVLAVPQSSAVRDGSEPAPTNGRRANFFARRKMKSDDHVGQQAQEAGALDGLGQFALLLRRDGGDARGHDLAALGNVARQQAGVLVVDLRRVRPGERAGLAAAEERTARGSRRRRWSSELPSFGVVITARTRTAAARRATRTVAAIAAIATVAAIVVVALAQHGGRAVFQRFDADRQGAQDVFVDRPLALDLGQSGRRERRG